MKDVFDAMDRLLKAMDAEKYGSWHDTVHLQELYRRFAVEHSPGYLEMVLQVLQECEELLNLQPFCNYFFGCIGRKMLLECDDSGPVPYEADMHSNEGEILWLLTTRFPKEASEAVSCWKDQHENTHLASSVLWPWMHDFGSTSDALWAADQQVFRCGTLPEGLFINRVKKGLSRHEELIPKLLEWLKHDSYSVSGWGASVLGFVLQVLADEGQQHLESVKEDLQAACKRDQSVYTYFKSGVDIARE